MYFFPLPDTVIKENYINQQQVNSAEDKTKEKLPTSHNQGREIDREELKSYFRQVFTYNGLEDQIPIAEAVIACESSWNWKADNGISYGIAQFTPATWEDFGFGDIMNPYSQIQVMARMWKNPVLRLRWDCFSGKR